MKPSNVSRNPVGRFWIAYIGYLLEAALADIQRSAASLCSTRATDMPVPKGAQGATPSVILKRTGSSKLSLSHNATDGNRALLHCHQNRRPIAHPCQSTGGALRTVDEDRSDRR
jgi:hypothetical protein